MKKTQRRYDERKQILAFSWETAIKKKVGRITAKKDLASLIVALILAKMSLSLAWVISPHPQSIKACRISQWQYLHRPNRC